MTKSDSDATVAYSDSDIDSDATFVENVSSDESENIFNNN